MEPVAGTDSYCIMVHCVTGVHCDADERDVSDDQVPTGQETQDDEADAPKDVEYVPAPHPMQRLTDVAAETEDQVPALQ